MFDGKREAKYNWQLRQFTLDNKLFIGMIPEKTEEKELLDIFRKYGPMSEFTLMKTATSRNKGYAFCHYLQYDDAIRAIDSLHGKIYLHVFSFF